MPVPENSGEHFTVICSDAIAESLLKLQREATSTKQTGAIASAFAEIVEQLRRHARTAGEANYNLTSLHLQVRTCAIAPLAVNYAVHEERPLVFIKGVKLLPRRGS